MNELIKIHKQQIDCGKRLLLTASVLAMSASLTDAQGLAAGDQDRPTVWIEVGGQVARVDTAEEPFAPDFVLRTPRPSPETISPLSVPHLARYDTGGEAKLSISPSGSDWTFSAAIRYGRSNASKHVHEQSSPIGYTPTLLGYALSPREPWAAQFTDAKTKSSGSDVVLDFQVGKDVGLGLFGRNASSTINLGVRYAQFAAHSDIAFRSDPDWHFSPKYLSYAGQRLKVPNGQSYHSYFGDLTAARSFHGVGPSLSINGAVALLGHPETSEVAFDWGVSGALLFGRQKAQTHHQTTAQYHAAGGGILAQPGRTQLYQSPTVPDHIRNRSVVVPNIGGFAGLSFRSGDAKVSFGYRADFFFRAMDGGIDSRKNYDRSFYGPFAAISIGLGG